MKRKKELEPFSRDHYLGLVASRNLILHPTPDSLEKFLELWREEMSDHFYEEERLLGPLASPSMREQMISEHDEIRALVASAKQGRTSAPCLQKLGNKVYAHIRWEERTLFGAIEISSDLSAIAEDAEAMEKRRQNSPLNPQRAEQVRRRETKSSE
ncbi:MAG TPA: hemerythrin domain-containing protein [Fimbriimonadaceae bacterium]|nr:hemerythrin domain-containing protein [Fimbriimonadaceae bacterium]